jgi:hypothetical protein
MIFGLLEKMSFSGPDPLTMIDAPRNRNTLPKSDKMLELVEVEVIWDVQ